MQKSNFDPIFYHILKSCLVFFLYFKDVFQTMEKRRAVGKGISLLKCDISWLIVMIKWMLLSDNNQALIEVLRRLSTYSLTKSLKYPAGGYDSSTQWQGQRKGSNTLRPSSYEEIYNVTNEKEVSWNRKHRPRWLIDWLIDWLFWLAQSTTDGHLSAWTLRQIRGKRERDQEKQESNRAQQKFPIDKPFLPQWKMLKIKEMATP